MKHLEKYDDMSSHDKYNELVPDAIVDTFHDRVKGHIDNKEDYEYLIRNLKKINGGKVPVKIQELIDKK